RLDDDEARRAARLPVLQPWRRGAPPRGLGSGRDPRRALEPRLLPPALRGPLRIALGRAAGEGARRAPAGGAQAADAARRRRGGAAPEGPRPPHRRRPRPGLVA